jgi:uncharacterized protein YaaW (UPF0174 family)
MTAGSLLALRRLVKKSNLLQKEIREEVAMMVLTQSLSRSEARARV